MNNIESTTSITSINDLTKDFLLQYIADLPREERMRIKQYMKDNPGQNASGTWAIMRGFMWNTYFNHNSDKSTSTKKQTFADQLEQILKF